MLAKEEPVNYSFTVGELKDWVNSIPSALNYEQVTYLQYDGTEEPRLDIAIMFKKKLYKPEKTTEERLKEFWNKEKILYEST